VVPGDKSISHRALILGAMAIGKTKISGISFSEDINNLIINLKLLGVKIKKDKKLLILHGVGVGGFNKSKKDLYMGNSGTATRLILGALCNQGFKAKITGDMSLNKRNMIGVIKPLQKMGAEIIAKNNKLPIIIKGFNDAMPIAYYQKVPSAQIKSSILIASLNSPGTTTIIENILTRDHTEILLKNMGAKINIKKNKNKKIIKIKGQNELLAQRIVIGGDPSAAAIVGSAALITPNSEVTIKNINVNETRITFFEVLKKMNANIKFSKRKNLSNEKIADITFKSSNLKGIHLKRKTVINMIDEIPIFSILASFAKGTSSFSNAPELKNKESDRIKSLYEGLTCCGVKVSKKKDGLLIFGDKINAVSKKAKIKTYYDHRIAMAFLIMGLTKKEGVIVDNTDCINTSFPNFLTAMKKIGAAFKKN